jgi:hypothetical protein
MHAETGQVVDYASPNKYTMQSLVVLLFGLSEGLLFGSTRDYTCSSWHDS